MQFKDIIGQEEVIERLRKTVKNNRISHALLLAGEEGVGKLALALAYAQYIACTNKTETDSCGTCASCTKYQKLIHPDLHFVFPVVKSPRVSKPTSDNYLSQWREMLATHYSFPLNEWINKIGSENAQAAIFTSESQVIIHKLNLKTFESEYKIMIIWHPDRMNTVTANKLLKMIEEPPPKTIFLLLTNSPEQILGTIFSRTQLIKIPKIEHQALKENLVQNLGLEQTKAEDIARVANGNYLKALEQMQASEQNRQNFEYFANLMRLSYVAPKDNSKIVDLIRWSEEISRWGREKQKHFIQYALRLFRENLTLHVASKNADNLVYLANKELAFSQKFSPFIHQTNTPKIYSEFNKAYLDISRNGAAKIVFLDLALQLVKLIRMKEE